MAEPEQKRVEGKWEEVKGTIKKDVGKLVGDENLQAEGAVQKATGRAEQGVAKAAGQAKGAWQEATGNVKEAVGKLVGDKSLEAEGKTRKQVNQ